MINKGFIWLRYYKFTMQNLYKISEKANIDPEILKAINSVYYRKTIVDQLELLYRCAKEKLFGVDCRVFDKTILWYKEVKRQYYSHKQALSRALNKKRHKDSWFSKKRETIADIMQFYQEIDVYPFRQPYNRRFGGFRWYLHLFNHIKNINIRVWVWIGRAY